MRKRLIAGILAAVMVVSSLQLQTVSVTAKEMYQETEEAALAMEDADTETQKQEEETAVEDAVTESGVESGTGTQKETPAEGTDTEAEAGKQEDEADNEDSKENEADDETEGESQENEDESEATEDETVTSDVGEVSEDEAQLWADENAEDIIDGGVINDIAWTLDKDGLLTITGTGDYISDGVDTPPWANRYDVLSAVVNVSGITSTKNMFYCLRRLKNIDLTNLDTNNVTDMSSMFYLCYDLTSLDLRNFETSNVTDMSSMFKLCGVTSLDLRNFDTGNVTDMSGMFAECDATSLDLRNFNTSNVTNMSGMFAYCDVTSLDLRNFDTSNVTDMSSMFDFCGVTSLDLRNFNTSNVTNMSSMFYRCYDLTSLDLRNFETSNVTDMSSMFDFCDLTSLDLSNFNTSNVTNMSGMFADCGVTSLDLSNFNTSNVTNMSGMFADCDVTSLDLRNFDTSNVTSMSRMFYVCAATSLDLSNFDTSNVTDMSEMFYYCDDLTGLDLSNFDTGKVTNMSQMFWNCCSLTSLDLSNFDTSNVKDMWQMFYLCKSLSAFNLGNFDMSSVTLASDMLWGCNQLSYISTPLNCTQSVELPTYHITDWYQDIDTICTELPTGLAYSIELYKNGYPGDGKTKRVVFVSGVTINSKEYNAEQIMIYNENAVVKDSEGNILSDVITSYSYKGTLADGSDYAETSEAPFKAGKYTLICTVEDDTYAGQSMYGFEIKQKELTITAPSLSIKTGEGLPELSGLKCTSEGLVKDEKLITEPLLRYSPDDIFTATAGSYDIIPYGVDAGNNYSIKYVNGTLTISESGENPPIGGGDDNPSHKDPDDDSNFDDDERIGLTSVSGTIADIKAKTYDGSPYEPTVKVTVLENNKKRTLTEGVDYRVVYDNNVNAGTGTVKVKGNGIYKGELTAAFTIKQKPIKKLKVVTGSLAVGDNLGEVPIPVYVYDGTKLLTVGEGKDYTISGTDNLTARENKAAKIIITAEKDSNYDGSITAKIAVYNVADASKLINPSDVAISYGSAANGTDADAGESRELQITYTGRAIKPTVTVTKRGNQLTKKEYKVQYKNNKDAGTAYVIITGNGSYKGTVVKTFEITAKEGTLGITKAIPDKTYNGKLQKPSVAVTYTGDGGKSMKLKKNKDYTIAYKNNLHAGSATITITGRGNYEGVQPLEQTFTIKPQKITKVSVKETQKGGLIVTYAKRQLKLGADYTLEYGEVKKNKVKVTIKAVEKEGEDHDFTGSVTKSVKMQ